MAFEIIGNAHTKWSGSRDEAGDREYVVTYRVKGNSTDGPASALETPGLPEPGSVWSIDDDEDQYAWCTQRAKATPVITDEPNLYFDVEIIFSTKEPTPENQRCQDFKVEDPLLEPPKVSGSFVNYNEEATHDRFGFPIVNSAHEQMRGPQVEFSKNRPRIIIEQNVASGFQAYVLPSMMMNTVNMFTLWGLPRRTILLAEAAWEQKFYGRCYVYYTRKLTFDVDYRTFDRDLLDEGTKVLHGRWRRSDRHWILLDIDGVPPDPTNPAHFQQFKDFNNENCRVILNGAGLPAGVCVESSDSSDYWDDENPSAPDQYMSVPHAVPNQGFSLFDDNHWIRLLNGAVPALWITTTNYERGNLIIRNGVLYLCLAGNTHDPPPSDNWQEISALTNRGTYNPGTLYGHGNYVTEPSGAGTGSVECEKTDEGRIGVEYYPESNFLMLGIPLDF